MLAVVQHSQSYRKKAELFQGKGRMQWALKKIQVSETKRWFQEVSREVLLPQQKHNSQTVSSRVKITARGATSNAGDTARRKCQRD